MAYMNGRWVATDDAVAAMRTPPAERPAALAMATSDGALFVQPQGRRPRKPPAPTPATGRPRPVDTDWCRNCHGTRVGIVIVRGIAYRECRDCHLRYGRAQAGDATG